MTRLSVTIGGAVGRGADGVVGAARPENTAVSKSGPADVQDLAHDDELAGVDGARQHVLHQLGHAVDGADLGAGAVDVRAHADAHVQPAVAVDDVVAGAAFDDVAAVAAEDDVAGAERGHAGAEQMPAGRR